MDGRGVLRSRVVPIRVASTNSDNMDAVDWLTHLLGRPVDSSMLLLTPKKSINRSNQVGGSRRDARASDTKRGRIRRRWLLRMAQMIRSAAYSASSPWIIQFILVQNFVESAKHKITTVATRRTQAWMIGNDKAAVRMVSNAACRRVGSLRRTGAGARWRSSRSDSAPAEDEPAPSVATSLPPPLSGLPATTDALAARGFEFGLK